MSQPHPDSEAASENAAIARLIELTAGIAKENK